MRENEIFVRFFFENRCNATSKNYKYALSKIYDLIKRYLSKRISNSQDLEDLTQDVVLAIHSARFSAEKEATFLGFIYAIAKYKLADFYRTNSRNPISNSILIEGEEFFNFLLTVSGEAEINIIQEDLGKLLSEREVNIFILQRVQGKTVHEIATSEELTVEAVKSISYRVGKKIKGYFQ